MPHVAQIFMLKLQNFGYLYHLRWSIVTGWFKTKYVETVLGKKNTPVVQAVNIIVGHVPIYQYWYQTMVEQLFFGKDDVRN